MRVVFFGSPDYAVPTLRGLLDAPAIEVVLVVTQPDRPRGRRGEPLPTPVKAVATAAGIEVLQPDRLRRASTERVAALAPDVGVVAASGHILPSHLLDVFPQQVLNVHASLLPRHRGASAVASAILGGDAESGATIMRVVREVDAGPILGVARTPIEPLDTTATLTERIARLGAARLIELLPAWVGGEVEAVPQDESRATYAPRLTKADGVIDWSLPATEIWRRVRAFQPWPLAVTTYRGEPFVIHEAWPLDLVHEGQPGTVLQGDGEALTTLLPDRRDLATVACGGGALVLLRVQRAGRRAIEIESFLNGDREFVGSRLGG